jgi:hypothetical protein
MQNEDKKCRLCREKVQCTPSPHRDIDRYEECACGAYYAHKLALDMAGDDIRAGKYNHLPALLCERSLRGNSPPLLVFRQSDLREAKENVTFADSIVPDDLLAQWPETVPERIDRCLCNLSNYRKGAGEVIKWGVHEDKRRDTLLFATGHDESRYYITALEEYGWVTLDGSQMNPYELVITPEGWARVGELTGGAERRLNPAFVAMWFGGKEQCDDMSKLYNDAILLAINDTGYHGKRADTDEHNEPIMDRVIEDIRKAPFVVAELTENNPGVYFEAGFAKGQGIEVIYCVPNDKGKKPHFDVSGINHVRWDNLVDLRKRLENRILGTMGHGPHQFSTTDLNK